MTCTLASAILSTATGRALADGDGTFSETYVARAPGLHAAAFGTGLAGRVAGLPPAPKTEALLEVDLPDGAEVELAYLYWVTFGDDGAATIDVDGDTLTGTLVGTSEGTCWDEYPTFENFVYRADVTDLVTGDIDLTLTGFPSGTLAADSQGASLFVVYTDPADDDAGTVILHDGAITMYQNNNATSTFADVRPPAEVVGGELLFGVGDGQQSGADGSLTLEGIIIPVPGDGQHWRSSNGTYWDTRTYDITSRIEPTSATLRWSQNFSQDCLVFAFAGLAFRAAFADADGDGVDDALDNCLGLANAEQVDSDDDGSGDACDPVDSGEGGSGPGTGGDGPASGRDGPASGGDGPASGGDGPASGGDGPASGGVSASGGASSDDEAPGGSSATGGGSGDARDDGGCGCQVVGAPVSASLRLALLGGLAGLVLHRRRRKARGGRHSNGRAVTQRSLGS